MLNNEQKERFNKVQFNVSEAATVMNNINNQVKQLS
jgi:hypothetical protein